MRTRFTLRKQYTGSTEGMVESVSLKEVLEAIEYTSQQLADPNFMASRPDAEYQFKADTKPEDIASEHAIKPINRLEAGIAMVNERGFEDVAEKFGFSYEAESGESGES